MLLYLLHGLLVHYLWLLFLRGKAWFTWTICDCLLCRDYEIASSIGLIPNGIVWSCVSSYLMLHAIESWDFQGYGIMLECLGLFGLFTTLERRIGQLYALIIHECFSLFPMINIYSLLCRWWIGRHPSHHKLKPLPSFAYFFTFPNIKPKPPLFAFFALFSFLLFSYFTSL